MSVGITKAIDPRKIPEHVLWTLVKDGRIAEVRPELRFMMRRGEKHAGPEDLLWSMVFKPEDGGGRALGEAVQTKKLEFMALGWIEDVEAFARHVTRRCRVDPRGIGWKRRDEGTKGHSVAPGWARNGVLTVPLI